MDLGVSGSQDDFEVLDAVVPHAYIVGNGIFEQDDVLVDDRQGTRKDASVDLRAFLSVKQDLTAPGMIEARDQFGNGGFAAAGGTDQGDPAAGLHGQVEILDQRFGQPGIAEGHMFELDRTGQLVIFHFFIVIVIGQDRVIRILHDVFDPFHGGPHLLQGLAGGGQPGGRRHKAGQIALELGDQTDGELALHGQVDAHDDDQHVGDHGHQGRDHAQILIDQVIFDVLGVDTGLITGPSLKVTFFRARGLDGFDHLDTGYGSAGQLAAVTHLDTGDIDPPGGYDPGHEDIDDHGSQAQNGQYGADPQHDCQIKDHHDRIQEEGGEGIDQVAGNDRVGPLSLLDIAGHPLGIKFHGQAENLPHIGGIAHNGHFAVDPQAVNLPHARDQDFQGRESGQSDDKGHGPVRILAHQQSVEEYSREAGIDQIEERGDHRGHNNKSGRRTGPLHPRFSEIKHTLLFSAGFKVLTRPEHQADAREGFVKLLHGYLHLTPGGVIEHGVVALKSIQYHKVVEIPVNDTGKFTVLFEDLRFEPVPFCLKTVISRGDQYIFRVGAVPGNTAVCTDLLQGDPLLIICQDHSQTGCPAFQGFQLHDDRNLCHAFADRVLDFYLAAHPFLLPVNVKI